MASVFEDTIAQALADQPWWVRRKDTITAVAGGILQLANLATVYTADLPSWAGLAVAAVIAACQIVIHAGTQGAITPSMARRLEQAGQQAHLDRPSVSGTTATTDDLTTGLVTADDSTPGSVHASGLAAYDGPTTSEGRHRREE